MQPQQKQQKTMMSLSQRKTKKQHISSSICGIVVLSVLWISLCGVLMLLLADVVFVFLAIHQRMSTTTRCVRVWFFFFVLGLGIWLVGWGV